jgi:hypothetical protein
LTYCVLFQGILHGGKFKTKTLKMNWHIPKPDFSRSISSLSADSEDHEVCSVFFFTGL